MARSYPASVTRVHRCGSDVVTLGISRPDGYAYAAAQWLRLALDTQEGRQTRTFTHASAPADEDLEITTRLSDSAFKRTLAALQPGDEVEFSGPGGRLALPGDTSRVAFLAGGVGITPVRSLLRDAAQRGRSFEDACVIYGNRDESCAVYLDELSGLTHMGVRVVPVFEHAGDAWHGETGFITAEVVRRCLPEDDERPVFVSGPPVMVNVMEDVLDALGIAKERRIVERFGVTTVTR